MKLYDDPTAADIAADCHPSTHAAAVRSAGAMLKSAPWWIGDVLNHPRTEPETLNTFGPMVDAPTAALYAAVADKFPPARRRTDVPWTHHRAVVLMPDEAADRLLARAAAENWTSRDLQSVVKRWKTAHRAATK